MLTNGVCLYNKDAKAIKKVCITGKCVYEAKNLDNLSMEGS